MLTCMAEEEKSTFQISSLLLSSFISNIYTRERLLLVKSAKQSEGKGVSGLRKNSATSIEPVIEINVCKRQGR